MTFIRIPRLFLPATAFAIILLAPLLPYSATKLPFRALSYAFADTIRWERIEDDLDTATIGEQGIFTPQILLFRTSLQKYRIEVVPSSQFNLVRAPVRKLVRAKRAILGINANFFDETGRALGLVMSRGIVQHPIHRGGQTLTGVFQFGQEGASIIPRAKFSPRLLSEAVQAGPRLITNGILTEGLRDIHATSRRVGVCITEDKSIVFFIVSNALVGMSLFDLQRHLIDPSVGCHEALNFDGGGSAQLYLADRPGINGTSSREELYLPGRDDIPVALTLSKK